METSMKIKMTYMPEGQRLNMEYKGSGSYTFCFLDLVQAAKFHISALNTLIELQNYRLQYPDEHEEKLINSGS